METKVFSASLEASDLTFAKSMQSELKSLISTLDGEVSLVDSKGSIFSDPFGYEVDINDLVSTSLAAIADPIKSLNNMYRELCGFVFIYDSFLSKSTIKLIKSMQQRIDTYMYNNMVYDDEYLEAYGICSD